VTRTLPNSLSLYDQLRMELAPAHGRMAGALRTAMAAMIATAILLYLQLPMLAPGVYLIYLISYDVPYLTFTRSLQEIASQTFGLFAALALIIVTDNAPMARVLGISAFTFISAFMLRSCTVRSMAINLGIFPVLTLTNWEMHRPPNQLIYLSAGPIFAGAISISCKIIIEYFFTTRDPHRALQLEIRHRLTAIDEHFTHLVKGASEVELGRSREKLTRFAFAGQSRMHALVEELSTKPERELAANELPSTVVPILAHLLDLAVALGNQLAEAASAEELAQLRRFSEEIRAIQSAEEVAPQPDSLHYRLQLANPLFAQIAQKLHQIHALRSLSRHRIAEPKVAAPVPWFRADAFTNPEYTLYAAKLSLSATLCYIIYNALGWPGISTACLTVMIAGLSTSGASNHKLFVRFIGAGIGGIVFGIGCQVFLYPNAETLLPFLVSIFVVSFIGAWIARGAHLGYLGMQIVFSFYLVAFQEQMMPLIHGGEFAPSALPVRPFTAPLALTQGRDRALGVLLALLVMSLVFHQLQKQRTIDRMRKLFAQMLSLEARQLQALLEGDRLSEGKLRGQVHGIVMEIRTLAETLPFEFDRFAEQDKLGAELMAEGISEAGTIYLHLYTHLQIPAQERESSQQAVRELTAIAEILAAEIATEGSNEGEAESHPVQQIREAHLRLQALSNCCVEG